jgi:hypothetical protein
MSVTKEAIIVASSKLSKQSSFELYAGCAERAGDNNDVSQIRTTASVFGCASNKRNTDLSSDPYDKLVCVNRERTLPVLQTVSVHDSIGLAHPILRYGTC